ncbi:MAG: DUF960 family protein [Bacillota bacterium]|nr:DUF960 family protein [Bacillota bacterium]
MCKSKEDFYAKGICENIPPLLQILMWELIQKIPVDKDYLQVFNLSGLNGKQKIEHIQEEPEYKREYLLDVDAPIFIGKIFVIDDETHSTMLLAEEY